MSLDNTRLIATAAARQAVAESKLFDINSGVFVTSTSNTTPTVIGSIAIDLYSAGILYVMCSGLDDSRNAFHIIKETTFKHDGTTLTVAAATNAFAPTAEVTASLSFVVNGNNIDITVTGTGNMNWKVSYMVNGVVNDAGLA